MRFGWSFGGLLLVVASALSGEPRKVIPPMPDHFEIGRMTFFDFGPPNNYYEIYAVHSVEDRAVVERVTLIPGYSYGKTTCGVPEKVEFASARLNVSVPALLQSVNPCEIPDKVLKHEEKRCKKCLVFSGAVVNMRVTCGTTPRLIPINIREEDWFDSRAKTPRNTAWSIRLLQQLDKPVGPTVMDQPIFGSAAGGGENESVDWDNAVMQEIADGRYDELFRGSPHTPSALVAGARGPHMNPTVSLSNVAPIQPEKAPLPNYPKLGEMVGAEGDVSFHFTIKPDGLLRTF